MAATVESLKIHLGLDPASTVDAEAMAQKVAAANAAVAALRPDWAEDDPWRPQMDEAANLLAARLYGRRGSVTGIAAYADVTALYVARMDPDVKFLLELDEYQQSVVA
jgi:hypothetical protein